MNIGVDIIQFGLYLVALIVLAPPLGAYMAKALNGGENFLSRFLVPAEKIIYKLLGVKPEIEMTWKQYTAGLLVFNLCGIVLLVLMQVLQQYLPLNPEGLKNVDFLLALNTAVSFVTNTNWQSYAGETTMSNFVQMLGLGVQNFLSAATGIAVLLALIRAIAARKGCTLGNFWVDISRVTLYVLIPLSVIVALILVSQGVVQTFSGYIHAQTLDGARQIIPLGPAASQIAIKQLGTNGGGFFNANSSFPFENPTSLSNFIQSLSILLIPAALVFTFGKLLNAEKHAHLIFRVMLLLFATGVVTSYISEISTGMFNGSALMEGKETRFGVFQSVLWSVATTAASSGSINAAMSSLSPLSGMIAMLNIQLGGIIFGGVGAGLYGMFLLILITVFISGLLIGRTPEYFGKKIEAVEIKWAIIAVLIPNIAILTFSSIAVATKSGLSSMLHGGPHGLSEVLYAFSSGAGNNGSAFAGLNANTDFYNILIALSMLLGRYGVIVPIMIIAGSLVKKNITPATAGTLDTNGLIFAFLLVSVILIIGALTFFPALTIGPFLEQLLLHASA